MAKEFPKILASIVLTSLLSIILKFISHPSEKQIKKLEDELKINKEENQIAAWYIKLLICYYI
jgi:hypothetical protein